MRDEIQRGHLRQQGETPGSETRQGAEPRGAQGRVVSWGSLGSFLHFVWTPSGHLAEGALTLNSTIEELSGDMFKGSGNARVKTKKPDL